MRFRSAAQQRSMLADANASRLVSGSDNLWLCLRRRPGKEMNSLAIVRTPRFVSAAWRAKPPR
jgi:hypothetical protein